MPSLVGSEMCIRDRETSVSSEKELRLAAEHVKIKAEDERLPAELVVRTERLHRAWNERWPWHVDGAVYVVSLLLRMLLFSYRVLHIIHRSTWFTARRDQVPFSFPGTCIRALARVRARFLRARASDPKPSSLHSIRRWTISCHIPNLLPNPRTHPFRVAQLRSRYW